MHAKRITTIEINNFMVAIQMNSRRESNFFNSLAKYYLYRQHSFVVCLQWPRQRSMIAVLCLELLDGLLVPRTTSFAGLYVMY